MARGKKTGGRRKGSRNKKPSVLAVKAEAAVAGAGGEQPLDFLLRLMRDPAEDKMVRLACAKAAANFVHPQLQAVAHRMLDASGAPLVPTINLTIAPPPAIAPPVKPQLDHVGPKEDDTVQ
jgi:hypothetical protein